MTSRTARVAITSAIIVPVLGIAAVLVYVDLTRDAPGGYTVLAAVEESAEPPQTLVAVAANGTGVQAPAAPVENPLRPVGPKASDRVTFYSSPSCSSGGCSTTSRPARSSCSSCD